jgi:hypothetical protein
MGSLIGYARKVVLVKNLGKMRLMEGFLRGENVGVVIVNVLIFLSMILLWNRSLVRYLVFVLMNLSYGQNLKSKQNKCPHESIMRTKVLMKV